MDNNNKDNFKFGDKDEDEDEDAGWGWQAVPGDTPEGPAAGEVVTDGDLELGRVVLLLILAGDVTELEEERLERVQGQAEQ